GFPVKLSARTRKLNPPVPMTAGALAQFPPRETQLDQILDLYLWYSTLFCPSANTPTTPGATFSAAGADTFTPPSDCQPCQSPLNARCQIALSVPRAKTSTVPVVLATAHGEDMKSPSMRLQPDQALLTYLCQQTLSCCVPA